MVQSKQRGRDARGVAQQARRAWQKAEHLFDEAVFAETRAQRVEVAWGLFRPEGRLNDRQWGQEQLADVIRQLEGAEWGKEPSQNNFSRFVLVLDSLVPESPVFCMGMPRILGEGQIPHTLRSTCFVKPRPLDGEHQSPFCRIQRS